MQGSVVPDLYALRASHGRFEVDGVAASGQQAQRIGAEAFFDAKLVRQPLVMKPWRGYRFGRIHVEIDGVDDDLQYRCDDARAARTAGDQVGFAVFEDDGGRHGR